MRRDVFFSRKSVLTHKRVCVKFSIEHGNDHVGLWARTLERVFWEVREKAKKKKRKIPECGMITMAMTVAWYGHTFAISEEQEGGKRMTGIS